ncbi:MAG: DUF6557 family protein [Eubacteriales bacterium]
MTTKELILSCDLEALVEEFQNIHEVAPEKVELLRSHMTDFLQRISKLEVEVSTDIILGVPTKDEWNTGLDVSVFYRKEIVEWKNSPDFHHYYPAVEEIPSLSLEFLDEFLEDFYRPRKIPESYCFMYEPWSKTLGYQVSQKNIETVGKVELATAFLYEMTFHGFQEEDMEKERVILDERIAELEELRKLPEEEQGKHFYTMDEVYANLGIERTVRTEEEKAESRLKSNKRTLEHVIYLKNTLCDVLKEIE